MAKKIIKEPTIRRYKATCPICDCEFELDITDIVFDKRRSGNYMTTDCPFCKFEIDGRFFERINE